MLKTLDVLIGATTVVLIFSMAVTVITQAITSIRGRKGKHLAEGLADLLQQLDIPQRAIAEEIANGVLTHPMFSEGEAWWGLSKKRKPGTVISREEFTKILLDAGQAILNGDAAKAKNPQLSDSAAYGVWSCIGGPARAALVAMLKNNQVSDPGPTLDKVRQTALQLEASNPELASNVRQSMALIKDASSPYLARVNAWFDQTIDRVAARFTKYTHYVTLAVAAVVVLSVQLDIIAVVDRLSADEKLRDGLVASAINDVQAPSANDQSQQKEDPPASQQTTQSGGANTATQPPTTPTGSAGPPTGSMAPGPGAAPSGGNTVATTPPASSGDGTKTAPTSSSAATQTGVPNLAVEPYYTALSAAGLIAIPFDSRWAHQWSVRKIPGMLLAILLVSLGAPFWYGILKDLLGLRPALAQKDDEQRLIRQTTQTDQKAVSTAIPSGADAQT